MVIHSRRKTERKPTVIKVENNLPPVATSGVVFPVGETYDMPVTYTVAATSEEKVNNKPRKKKKRVVEE